MLYKLTCSFVCLLSAWIFLLRLARYAHFEYQLQNMHISVVFWTILFRYLKIFAHAQVPRTFNVEPNTARLEKNSRTIHAGSLTCMLHSPVYKRGSNYGTKRMSKQAIKQPRQSKEKRITNQSTSHAQEDME